MKIRPATETDLRHLFGGVVPTTMRAIVVENPEGKIVGIGGVARQEDHLQAFSRVEPELRAHKVTMGRVAVLVSRIINELGCVWAVCSDSEPTAPGMLEWAGFKHAHDGVWVKKKGGA
jgi:hypothetical protein